MSCKYVVGSGIFLSSAMAAWRELAPTMNLHPVPLEPDASQADISSMLDALDLTDATAFVAGDARFLNFRRLEVVEALRLRGVPMPQLVSRSAIVAEGMTIGDNVWIGQGAIVQYGSQVGRNVRIGAGAIVGAGAVIGDSVWIDDGVVIGREAKIGTHATLGLGVIVAHGVDVGALCVIDKPGRIETDLAARTFIHSSHDRPLVVTGA